MATNLKNKWAVATVSLGKHASHTLEHKIAAVRENGFHGIELVHAELLAHASQHDQSPVASAAQIKALCAKHSVEILSLNPLKNFEGNLESSLEDRLSAAREWVDLAVALGTRYVQMPSQFLAAGTRSTGDFDIIIPELQALADMAAESGISIAYEAVAFAAWNPLWQDSVRVVQAVDRPNFGLCLDSFHIHSRIWGSAFSPTGTLPGGAEALEESMKEFLATCPRDKVFYLQLSDASRFEPPLTEDSPLFDGLEVKDSRLAWSRSARPFPLEKPGYFPVAEIAQAWLLDYGWTGWVSLEGFLKETEEEKNNPEVMGARARTSVVELCNRLGVVPSLSK
ncbi:putative 4-hydroxyphenylpyruvate dioxygenase [Thozetella sp. PMI_491]|nr:putative 4-hydroxyphenylpyruvate dioxygenase [Thozetella sp. PMI_491]